MKRVLTLTTVRIGTDGKIYKPGQCIGKFVCMEPSGPILEALVELNDNSGWTGEGADIKKYNLDKNKTYWWVNSDDISITNLMETE